MRNKTIIRLIVAACVITTTQACTKSSKTTTTPTPTPVTTAFTFKVDGGAAITVDSANAMLYNLPGGARYMDVYAYKGGSEILEFHFTPQTGSTTAGTTLGTTLMTYMETVTSSYDSQSGNLSITTCDTVGNKILGDFNFVGKVYPYTGSPSHAITEGHMVVSKITKQ